METETNKSPKKYKTHSAEYRSNAIRLAREGESLEQTANSLGMSVHTLRTWVRSSKELEKKSSVKNSSGKNMLDLEEENKRLAREIERLERTNKVLKIAAAFFSQDQLESDMRSLKK